MNEKNTSDVKSAGREVNDAGTGESADNLKAIVNEELARIGSGGPWVWYVNLIFDRTYENGIVNDLCV